MKNYKKIFIGLTVLFLSVAGIQAQDYNTYPIGPFGTLNNTDNSLTLPGHMAQDLLNVDITPAGTSIKKREGYAIAYTLNYTTSPVHGIYRFYNDNANSVSLFFNDIEMISEISGLMDTIFSNGAFGATYQCTDHEGYAYCVNDERDRLIKTDGVTYSEVVITTTGTMIISTQERLVTSGFTGSPNRIDFSAANDFTNWTIGGNPTSPTQETIVSPGSKITHITYAFNRVMWFKDESFGYILDGPTLNDWVLRIVSPTVGTLRNTSVYYNGILYFQGQDFHIYAYNGATLTQLTQAIGTTLDVSQAKTSEAWLMTTQADWETGTISTTSWLSTTILPKSIVLATNTANTAFTDTATTDFQAGTMTYCSASGGNVTLDQTTEYVVDYGTCPTYSASAVFPQITGSGYVAQQFIPTNGYTINKISMWAERTGTVTNCSLSIWWDDSFNNPGGSLSSKSFPCTDIPVGSMGKITVTLDTLRTVYTGVKYWVKLTVTGDFLSGDYIAARENTDTGCWDYPNLYRKLSGLGSDTSTFYAYEFAGSTYRASGTFLSQAYDTTSSTDTWLWKWSDITYSKTEPTGSTTITFETQVSDDGSTWDALVASNDTIGSDIERYIRYKATLATTDGARTPTLSSTTITPTARIRPGATWYSLVQTELAIDSWSNFSVSKLDDGGIHAFSIRSASFPFSVDSATVAWSSISNGEIPIVAATGYFQIKDEFTVTEATQNPVLYGFALNWYEQDVRDKTYATYFDDAIWWSVASGVGELDNNYILRYDLINAGWTLYDFGANGFLTESRVLYFGSPTSGHVYRFGDVESDNGSAINAYWKSKDYFVDSLFTDKELSHISASVKSVINSSVTVTYDFDGTRESNNYEFYAYDATKSFVRNNRNIEAGKFGETINFKIGNNAADQPFEIFGLQFGYRSKPWRETE